MTISDGSFYAILTSTILFGILLNLIFYLAWLKRKWSQLRSCDSSKSKLMIIDPVNIFYLFDSIEEKELHGEKTSKIYASIGRIMSWLKICLVLTMLSIVTIFILR